MEKKLSFTIDTADLLEEISDQQLTKVRMKIVSEGNNAHDMPISWDTILLSKPSLKGKPVLCHYKSYTDSFGGHDPEEIPVGVFLNPEEVYEEEIDGKRWLIADCYIWKIYFPEIISVLKKNNGKSNLSMEIQVLETQKMDDGLEHITLFAFLGVTLIGVEPAIKDSGATVVKFADMVKKTEEYLFAKEITNFPTQGENKEISLSNSRFPQFDYKYAETIKNNYPWLWKKGGNIRGNEAFEYWTKINNNDESEDSNGWIKEREAWASRHQRDKNLAGVIANVKWGVIVSRGEKYMKDLIDEEIQKHEPKKMFEEEIITSVNVNNSNNSEVDDIKQYSESDIKQSVQLELSKKERDDEKVDRKEMKAKMSAVIGECKYQKDDKEFAKFSKALSYDDSYVYAIDKETGNMSAIPYSQENEEIKCSYDAVKMARLKCEAYDEGEDEEAIMMSLQEEFSSDQNTEATAQEELEEKQAEDNKVETDEDKAEDKEPDVHDEMMEALKNENIGMQAKNDELSAKMSAMEEEMVKLKEFQSTTLENQRKAQVEFTLGSVTKDLPEEKINEWREKSKEYSNISDWENAVQAEAYRFSRTLDKKEDKDFIVIPSIKEEDFSTKKNKTKSIWDNI